MDLIEAVKEAQWLKGMMGELGHGQKRVSICFDGKCVVHLSKHQVFHERSKHIDVKLHSVRDVVETGSAEIKKISTD